MSEVSARGGRAPNVASWLCDAAPCGLLTLDADGVIVQTNSTFAGWLAAPASALVGRPFRDLLSTPGRILFETNVAPSLLLEGSIEEVTLDFALAGSETLPALVAATSRPDSGGSGVVTDVAVMRARGRRSYERDLRRQEALSAKGLVDARELAELREQFIAVLGHDLRNPLASIVGAARLLRRDIPGEKAARVLDMMEGSVDRMAGLIDDVMDFARGRLGGGIGLDAKLEPLEPILQQVVEEFEADQPERSIEVRYDLPVPVRFDRGRLAQLVSNLIGNALVYGDPKAPVRLEAHVRGSRLILAVANAGTPIPEAAMEQLFQPFVRGEVRPNQQGLGLGLHIAFEIARAHAGTLNATSTARETRFTLDMPVDPDVA